MRKILTKMWHWQIFIVLTILGIGFIHNISLGVIAGFWVGWTVKKGWDGTKFIPVQMSTIIISSLLAILLPIWLGLR